MIKQDKKSRFRISHCWSWGEYSTRLTTSVPRDRHRETLSREILSCFIMITLFYTWKKLWSYLPNLSTRAGYDTMSIFKRSLTGFNSEISFSKTSCLTKAEEPSLSYNLPIDGGRIIGFIPYPRVLVLCEMQSVSSSIWTRVAVSISYDDNNYTTGTSWKNCDIPPYFRSL